MLKPYYNINYIEAGLDEAGRGCLAGPVVAAAVILPKGFSSHLLNDSKKLNPKAREEVFQFIIENALSYSVGFIDNLTIDRTNILKASIQAMHEAVKLLNTSPEHLLVDGNRFYTYPGIIHTCIIKGDSKYQSIAAASIVAKVSRDRYMSQLSMEYPEYKWVKNKGYPTQEHRQAIKSIGITRYHRKSFQLLPKLQLSL